MLSADNRAFRRKHARLDKLYMTVRRYQPEKGQRFTDRSGVVYRCDAETGSIHRVTPKEETVRLRSSRGRKVVPQPESETLSMYRGLMKKLMPPGLKKILEQEPKRRSYGDVAWSPKTPATPGFA